MIRLKVMGVYIGGIQVHLFYNWNFLHFFWLFLLFSTNTPPFKIIQTSKSAGNRSLLAEAEISCNDLSKYMKPFGCVFMEVSLSLPPSLFYLFTKREKLEASQLIFPCVSRSRCTSERRSLWFISSLDSLLTARWTPIPAATRAWWYQTTWTSATTWSTCWTWPRARSTDCFPWCWCSLSWRTASSSRLSTMYVLSERSVIRVSWSGVITWRRSVVCRVSSGEGLHCTRDSGCFFTSVPLLSTCRWLLPICRWTSVESRFRGCLMLPCTWARTRAGTDLRIL